MAKNIQIPEALFLDLYFFFEQYEGTEGLQGEEQKRLMRIKHGISQKAAAIMARNTYGEYRRCHKDEKGAKLQNYLDTKEFYRVRGARHGNI